MLDFVQPGVASGRLLGGNEEARLDKPRREVRRRNDMGG